MADLAKVILDHWSYSLLGGVIIGLLLGFKAGLLCAPAFWQLAKKAYSRYRESRYLPLDPDECLAHKKTGVRICPKCLEANGRETPLAKDSAGPYYCVFCQSSYPNAASDRRVYRRAR